MLKPIVIGIALLCAAVLPLCSNGQQDRVGVIYGPNYNWAGSIALYQDSLLVLAGATWPYYYSHGRGLLNIIDKNLKLRYQLVGDGSTQRTSFKSVVVYGDTIMCFGSKRMSTNNGGFEGAVFKFTGYAEPTVYTYGDSLYESFFHGFRIGNFSYGIGETKSNTYDPENRYLRMDLTVVKIRPDGSEVWNKRFGTTWRDHLKTAAVASNKAAILLAGTRWFSDDTTSNYTVDTVRCYATLVDTNGNEIWHRSFSPKTDVWSNGTGSIFAAAAVSDGFIIGGQWNSSPFIGKINLDGDTLWFKYFKDAPAIPFLNRRWSNGFINEIKILRGGDLLLVGRWDDSSTWFDDQLFALYGDRYGSGFVARYSQSGDSIWRYNFKGAGDDYFLDAVEDNLGYIYACGHTMPSASELGAVLVVKLDAYGCVMDTCLMPEPIQPLPAQPAIPLRIYPNPFNDALVFEHYGDAFDESIRINVFDATGRLFVNIETIAVATSRNLETSHWPVGFYIVQVQANGLVERFKVVKQ